MIMKRILVVRLSALGDVAMTVPVIYSVAQQYPQVRFTIVTRPFFRRLFICAPENVNFVDFDSKNYKGFGGLLRFIAKLKKEHFDAVADLHDILRSRIIRTTFRLGGTKVAVVNKERRARKLLINHKLHAWQRNYVDRYADVFAQLGYPVEVNFKGFFQVEANERSGVGIAPFARYDTKAYPSALMERVARGLTERGVAVTLFGAKGPEQAELEQWVQRNPALKTLAGKLPIEEELQAMSKLQLMITMDSANMHLASLVGTRVISIWGSTIPACGFLGYGQSASDAVSLGLQCQPCSVAGLRACPLGHCNCLNTLSPGIILEKCQGIEGIKE